MAKHYENIIKTSLEEYIPVLSFRTVMPPQWEGSAGYSELPVAVTLKKKAASQLSFEVPWDGMIYGFVRSKFDIQKKLGMNEVPVSAALNDWEDRFMLVFDNGNPKEVKAFEVSTDDVIFLLENCRRTPEQRSVR